MGLLTATFGGQNLPIKITKLDRNLTPPMKNTTQTVGNRDGAALQYSAFEESTITIDYVD